MTTSPKVMTLLLLAILAMDGCYSATIPRNYDPRLNEEMVLTPKKRPFCNAFTGCGRKRAQGAPGMPVQELMRQRQFADDDALGQFPDSENVIDDLSRQILSEAKLWEAFQDAAEIARRKQKDLVYN
ncbi:cardioactive peptide [Pectinophora gossypiella]|uniref:cardioactive peptide n=1 Tax=Pectinophora gossypiella TaxID=13191 RepID=UPI00214F2E66|nr:cardioactive peptide [Pectinophora gossypiella]